MERTKGKGDLTKSAEERLIEMGERRGMKALELWCRRVTQGYPGVKVENMTTSWRDGLAFCAIIHHFRPDLIDFTRLDKSDIYGNNELAFRTAERHLGIPSLLDAEDMLEYPVPDKLSILTYLSLFYQAFASNGSSPIKRPAETSDGSLMLVSQSVQSPPNKVSVGCGREPCAVCNLPVFIAQRLRVAGKLYHRTCFRCARCDNQLSVADFYETHDGQYCCETCPDEMKEQAEEEVIKPPETPPELPVQKEVVTKVKPEPPEPPPPTSAKTSLVNLRRMMFETYSKDTDDAKLFDNCALKERGVYSLPSSVKDLPIKNTSWDNRKDSSVDCVNKEVVSSLENDANNGASSESFSKVNVDDISLVIDKCNASEIDSVVHENEPSLVSQSCIEEKLSESVNPVILESVSKEDYEKSEVAEPSSEILAVDEDIKETYNRALSYADEVSQIANEISKYVEAATADVTFESSNKISDNDNPVQNDSEIHHSVNVDEISVQTKDQIGVNVNEINHVNIIIPLSTDKRSDEANEIISQPSEINPNVSNKFNESQLNVEKSISSDNIGDEFNESWLNVDKSISSDNIGDEFNESQLNVDKSINSDNIGDEFNESQLNVNTSINRDITAQEFNESQLNVNKSISSDTEIDEDLSSPQAKHLVDVDEQYSSVVEDNQQSPPIVPDISDSISGNPFETEDEDQENINECINENIKPDVKVYDYPEDLNPFADEEVEKPIGTNPFGSDSEEEKEKKSLTPAKRYTSYQSLNPFDSDDEADESYVQPRRQPVPMPRRTLTPEPSPMPRSRLRASGRSIGSVCSLSRKKKPAPLPPSPSPSVCTLASTASNPRSRKAKRAPLPPSPATARTLQLVPIAHDIDINDGSSSTGKEDKKNEKENLGPSFSLSPVIVPIDIEPDVTIQKPSEKHEQSESDVVTEEGICSLDELENIKNSDVDSKLDKNIENDTKNSENQEEYCINSSIGQRRRIIPLSVNDSCEDIPSLLIGTEKDTRTSNVSTPSMPYSDDLSYQDLSSPPSEKKNKDSVNLQVQSIDGGTYNPNKSTFGQWKRKKGPAPSIPFPTLPERRTTKPMPILKLKQELEDIEVKQQGLERQGVALEKKIREKFTSEVSVTPYVEELVLQLFELVNEKNDLFRKQAELMYLRRQYHLEEEHAELEYKIRCLMARPEANKTDSDKELEECLIQRLIEVVERRDAIVQCLERDRLREAEEDKSVNAQLNKFTEAMGAENTTKVEAKSGKKHKKTKKEKLMGTSKSIDLDKDLDETEKEYKKKKKWFTLNQMKTKH